MTYHKLCSNNIFKKLCFSKFKKKSVKALIFILFSLVEPVLGFYYIYIYGLKRDEKNTQRYALEYCSS